MSSPPAALDWKPPSPLPTLRATGKVWALIRTLVEYSRITRQRLPTRNTALGNTDERDEDLSPVLRLSVKPCLRCLKRNQLAESLTEADSMSIGSRSAGSKGASHFDSSRLSHALAQELRRGCGTSSGQWLTVRRQNCWQLFSHQLAISRFATNARIPRAPSTGDKLLRAKYLVGVSRPMFDEVDCQLM